jgi:hypothetical protein
MRRVGPVRRGRDRDIHAFEQAMAHLDAEEASAKASTKVVSAAEAVAWLHDLPALWAAADDSGRRLLTEAIFEKVEVLGSSRSRSTRRQRPMLTAGRRRSAPCRYY